MEENQDNIREYQSMILNDVKENEKYLTFKPVFGKRHHCLDVDEKLKDLRKLENE